jgi:hypothetical protein
MRGAPWIRFVLMAAALALTAIPIRLVTRTDEPPLMPPAPVHRALPEERELTLTIETAPAAQAIGASYLGRELIPPAHEAGSFSGVVRIPASAADLLVRARWSGTETAAIRVRASDENGLLAEASFWGTKEVQDVITVPEASQ